MNINIKTIIFDLDGVITHTMPYHFKAWKIVFKKAGINVTREDIYKREGQRGLNSILGICKDKKIVISRSKAMLLLSKKEILFKKIAKQRFIIGSRAFIRDLFKKGFRLALVTGTSLEEVKRILPFSLRRKFSVIVTSCDVKYGKPHPEPFQKALKLLRVEPVNAVVIENSPLGINSAKSAGIRCFAIETSLGRRYLTNANVVFSNFKELKERVSFTLIP